MGKFKLADPSTWRAVVILEVEDPKWGRFRFNTGSSYTSVWLLLIQCKSSGLPFLASELPKVPKPMWLGWLGEEMPSLEQTWRCYLRAKVCR